MSKVLIQTSVQLIVNQFVDPNTGRRLYYMQVAIPHGTEASDQSFASLDTAGNKFLDSFELGEEQRAQF